MNRFVSFAGAGILSAAFTFSGFAQSPGKETPQAAATRAAEAAAKVAFFNAKVKEITDQLHSKVEAENAVGLAEMKKWVADDLKDGAKCVSANLNFMLWDKRYWSAIPALVDAIETAQKDPPFLAKIKIYKGYALIQDGKSDEGNKIVARAFIEYPNEAGTVASTDIINGLKSLKRNNEVMDLSLRLVMAKPDNTDLVDRMIKTRISILNASNKEADALVELKRLFNACAMEKTAAVLTSMDQQIRLMHIGDNDATMLDRFHKEQLEALPPDLTKPGAKEQSVMGSIKVNSDGFDSAMEAFDAETFQGAQQRCILMCLADKGDEALKWAKRAFGQANNPPQVKTAVDLIARSLKTQDGNVGRARDWVASNNPQKPAAAAPVIAPATPSTSPVTTPAAK